MVLVSWIITGQKSCWMMDHGVLPPCPKEASSVQRCCISPQYALELYQIRSRAGIRSEDCCACFGTVCSRDLAAEVQMMLVCSCLTGKPWGSCLSLTLSPCHCLSVVIYKFWGPFQQILSLLHDKVHFPPWCPFSNICWTDCLYSLT